MSSKVTNHLHLAVEGVVLAEGELVWVSGWAGLGRETGRAGQEHEGVGQGVWG